MIQCRFCGSTTGQHGFSFSEQGIKAQVQEAAKEAKKNAGILYIPREIVPEGKDEEEFLAEFLSAINDSTRPCAPEVRWANESEALNTWEF